MTDKIGILGGTFNPIHIGHLKLATLAQHELALDTVIFIPSGISYMKKNVLSSDLRLQMTELATSEYPGFCVSDIEIRRTGNSYSYVTLETLKSEHPKSELFFIVGADSFLNIDKWRCPGRIFRAASIAVLTRNDTTEEELHRKAADYKRIFGANVFFIHAPVIDISSTQIRNMIKNGESADKLLPPSVYKFIKEQNLYLKEPVNE